jgi:hypothetical protein
MTRCDTCGNDYANSFAVTTASGENYTFDSIECAAQAVAPACGHCGCRILGHGIEAADGIYCCANCARATGADAVDNVRAGGGR